MHNRPLTSAMLAALLVTSTTLAIDRDARMIDRVQVDMAQLDDADSFGASLWGEIALAAPEGRWAVLAGLGMGTISPDNEPNDDYWGLGIGLKYYLSELTSASVLANYVFLDNGSDRDIKGAGGILKHRLVSATEPVSPFLKGGIWIRERSTFSDSGITDDSISETLAEFGGGIEFAANESLSFVFEASYMKADGSDDETEDLDGWVGAISMQYYWR